MAAFLFAELGSTVVFLLAMVVAIVILLRRSYRYFGRRSKSSGPLVQVPRPATTGIPSSLIAPAEHEQWEVHMHETARELSAQLDSKMIALGHLIRDADAKVARLESLLAQGQDPHTPEPPQSPDSTAGKAAPQDPQHREIYSLADQGFSAVTIAHRVGTSLGTVESILLDR